MTQVLLFFLVSHCETLFLFSPVTNTRLAQSWQMCPVFHTRENSRELDTPAVSDEKMDFKIKRVSCLQSVLDNWNSVGDIKGCFLPAGFRIFPPKLTSTAELTRIPTVLFSGPKVSSKAEIHKMGLKELKGWVYLGPIWSRLLISSDLYFQHRSSRLRPIIYCYL